MSFRSCFIVCACVVAPLLRAQTPALIQPLPAQSLVAGGGAATLDLKSYFALPGVAGQVAQIDTVAGRINLELFATDTPKTVANFRAYVTAGRYKGTFIHRSVPGFVVQGGGYTATVPATRIETFPAVANEPHFSNVRGTVAMAKLNGDPNSATSEWFFNLADNSANLDSQNGGFTVFARVLGTGMDVVDAIAALPRYKIGFDGANDSPSTPLRDVPAGATDLRVEYYVKVNDVKVIPIYPDGSGGAAVLSFSAASSDASVLTAEISGAELTLTPRGSGTATITVTATDTNGNKISDTSTVTVAASTQAPTITAHPQPLAVMASGTASTIIFTVAASGAPTPAYQWRHDGNDIRGATNATLVLTGATSTDAGRYTCLVKNSVGSAESIAGLVSFISTPNPGRLVNLSILTALGAGETMTMGTVLGGAGTSGSKALLARAAGPSLAQFGVSGTLPDPTMTLVSTSVNPAVAVATNDDWGGTSELNAAFAQVAAFGYTSGSSKDAAIFRNGATALQPGTYTLQVKDAGTGAGTVIAELYDATPAASRTSTTPRLVNVSVLKQIAAGNSLTAGFVIGGSTYRTVLVRAIGPGLTQFGVGGVMADPQLTLFNGANQIAANDNWGGDAQLTAIGTTVGAFKLDNVASKDAVLVMTLGPGNYSARVADAAGAGGTALVEVYEVP